MTSEELNSVKRIREEIKRKNSEIEMLRVMSVPTSTIDGQPRTKPPPLMTDPTADMAKKNFSPSTTIRRRCPCLSACISG